MVRIADRIDDLFQIQLADDSESGQGLSYGPFHHGIYRYRFMGGRKIMDKKKKIKIAVLMGGHSAERDVSLATGAGVIKGLSDAGFNAIGIDTALGANQPLRS
jgi:hypothetical protein